MNRCDSHIGERYVAGLLSHAEESSFVEHLDTCAPCREQLEAIAGNEGDWQTIRELLKYSCVDHRGEDSRHAISENGTSSLSFLAATDDPAMIGRIGPYEIRGVLGRGGFGWVLKGHDRALDRIVAIKILDPAAASVGAARERFAREARAMASISHEHVVPVYAVDTHAGLPYFVMEYVAGGSLERRLKAEGQFDLVSIVRIGLQIAQALAVAHAQGLVHRDIKPGNVLLDRGTERVRVADFGLARVASEVSSTRSGFIAGTPQYMAPEQVRGETCDAQSDLFSLGAVMYELSTGHAPFRADSVYGVMQRIVNDAPRGLREQNPAIPVWLERFVRRLLEKDKQRRFATADEVARLLQDELAYLQNPAQSHEPQRAWSRQAAAARRLRSWTVAAGAAMLLALTILAGILLFQSRPHDDANRADANENVEAASAAAPSLEPANGANEGHAVAVPLWAVDGTSEAVELAKGIEESWHAPSEHRVPGSWSEQTSAVRRGLEELSVEIDRPSRE